MDTSDSDYGGNSSILDSLLEKAELQGHLTMEDLEEIIPRSGASTETLDELVIALNDQGVQVLCQEDEEDETDEDFDDAESVISYSPASSHAQSQSDDSITLYLRRCHKSLCLIRSKKCLWRKAMKRAGKLKKN